MSSEVTVFVVYDEARAKAGDLAGLLREKHPSWQISGSGGSFQAGLYDSAPVVVGTSGPPHVQYVQEESEDMAERLAAGGVPADIVSQVRGCDARFEILWDLTRDEDLVPDTGGLVSEIAQAAVDLTGGVALVNGSRLFRLGTDELEACDQLFPKS